MKVIPLPPEEVMVFPVKLLFEEVEVIIIPSADEVILFEDIISKVELDAKNNPRPASELIILLSIISVSEVPPKFIPEAPVEVIVFPVKLLALELPRIFIPLLP